MVSIIDLSSLPCCICTSVIVAMDSLASVSDPLFLLMTHSSDGKSLYWVLAVRSTEIKYIESYQDLIGKWISTLLVKLGLSRRFPADPTTLFGCIVVGPRVVHHVLHTEHSKRVSKNISRKIRVFSSAILKKMETYCNYVWSSWRLLVICWSESSFEDKVKTGFL